MLNINHPHSKRRASESVPEGSPTKRERSVTRRALFALAGLGLVGGGLGATQALAAEAEAYVSAFKVREQTDGVGPFDADDEPGNDSGANNRIVRSFDSVNYLLEYTTELTDRSHPVTGAIRLIAEFTLPMDPSKARFDTQTLNWAIEPKTTYVYTDGTQSETWDRTKPVARQVYSAVRLLEGKGADDRVPGAGQLSVGILVYAAVQGEKIDPTFKLHIEGDSRSMSCKPEVVTVSSYPRFNVRLMRYSSSMNRQGYFNFDDGSVNREDAEGLVNGRHEAYALSLRLHNTSSDKVLKGLEIPVGPITFDLHMSTAVKYADEADERDMSDDPEWCPLLWDYKESVVGSLNTRGKLGRNIAPYEATQSYPCWTEFTNKGGGLSACYNGGIWSIEQDAVDDDVYHVTIDGYQFDLEDFTFPVRYQGNSANHIDATPNIGAFSAGYVQFVAAYPREVDATLNYFLRAQIENFHATTESTRDVTWQQLTSDDYSSFTVPLYVPGTINKYVDYVSVPGGKTGNSPTWNAGDGYGPAGANTRVAMILTYTGDEPITAWNTLLKFDDELLYLPPANEFKAALSTLTVGSTTGDMVAFFAAKPDGSGWTDQTEMNQTPEEGLIYFDTLEALEASGRTCVGLLAEIRNCCVYGGRDQAAAVSSITCYVRDDAEPGRVAVVVNDLRAWRGDEMPMSWGDLDAAPDGHYGTGEAGTEHKQYIAGYLKPYADIYRNYAASIYQNGTLVGGHTGGVRYGDSLLIVGAKNGITITVNDQAGDRPKTTYDLDANERTATFKLQPTLKVSSSSTETPGVGLTTDLNVEVTLPVGLTYDNQTASLAPVDVVPNDDGTQTIKWVIPNVAVGSAIDPITFACTIGAAGTDHDVDNNEQLTVESKVTSDLDQRKVSKENGNLSETTIVCVKLAAISVFKQVTPAHANPNDPHSWMLRFGNSSETDVTEVGLVDTMPYTGDDRGSNFHGTYTVEKLTLDLSSASKLVEDIQNDLDAVLWVTADADARTIGDDAMLSDPDTVQRTFLGRPDSVSGGVYVWELGMPLDDIVAWGLVFDTMHGQEYLTVKLDIKPEGAKSGDVYVNSFTENAHGQAAIVHSNVVRTDVESVSFSVKKVWATVNGITGTPDVSVVVVGTDGSEQTLALNDGNNWTNSVAELNRYEADGTRIEYTVEERNVPDGYELGGITGSDTEGFTVTNEALTGFMKADKAAMHESWL